MNFSHEQIAVPRTLAPHEKLAVGAVHSVVLSARERGRNQDVLSADGGPYLHATSYQGDTVMGRGEVQDTREITDSRTPEHSTRLSVELDTIKPSAQKIMTDFLKDGRANTSRPTNVRVKGEISGIHKRPHEVVTETRKVETNSGHSKRNGRYNSNGSSTVHRHTTHGSNPGGQEFVLTLKGDSARKHAELTTKLAARKIAERTTHQKGKPHKRQQRK